MKKRGSNVIVTKVPPAKIWEIGLRVPESDCMGLSEVLSIDVMVMYLGVLVELLIMRW